MTAMDAAGERVDRALLISSERLAAIVDAFREAIERGLSGAGSSLRMLPTFVTQPRGDERGRALVVDWGGTHARAVLAELDGRGECLPHDRSGWKPL